MTRQASVDERLKEWCLTDAEVGYIDAVNKHGGIVVAADALGHSDHSHLSRSIARIKRRAAAAGYSPAHDMTRTVPEGFSVKGVSTYYDQDGKPRGQWVKSAADEKAREQAMRDFADTLAHGIKQSAPIVEPPKHALDDLLCVYPMGDPHFGMYAWEAEAGADFDLTIAERLTKGAIDRLVSTAPAAGTAILLNLGDMFHADNQSNQTQSGHQLDVDGRRAKVQDVALMAMVHCIQRLLEKHQAVYVRNNKGNHDKETSYALSVMLSCWFRNEPRVFIDRSPAVCWYMQFGNVLVASTHGDTIKGKDMLAVMAADKPKEWGQTTHRYWYVGHVHHDDVKEYPGGKVEYMRTLAPRDAWHQGQGYRAGRDMRLIVHHKEYGEIERHRCDVGMLA